MSCWLIVCHCIYNYILVIHRCWFHFDYLCTLQRLQFSVSADRNRFVNFFCVSELHFSMSWWGKCVFNVLVGKMCRVMNAYIRYWVSLFCVCFKINDKLLRGSAISVCLICQNINKNVLSNVKQMLN